MPSAAVKTALNKRKFTASRYLLVKVITLVFALAAVLWAMKQLQGPADTGVSPTETGPISAKVITTKSPNSKSQNSQY